MSNQVNLSGAEFVAEFISTPSVIVTESNYPSFQERLKEEIDKKPKFLRLSYTGRLSHDFYTKIANEIAETLEKADFEGIELQPDEVFKLILEVKNNKKEVKEYPKTLFMELTRNCNGLCAMCTRQRYKELQRYDEKWNMSFSLFKKVADELFPHADYIDLRGFGESTILPNFLDFLDYTKKFGCGIGLITNLTVRNDKIWEELVAANARIGISFDASYKELYEKIRLGSSFDNVMHNLRLISKLSKDKDKCNSYFTVAVQKDNIEDVPNIVTLAAELGLDNVELNPVLSKDHSIFSVDKDVVDAKVREAKIIAEKEGINLRISASLSKDFHQDPGSKTDNVDMIDNGCLRPWNYLYVMYDGRLGPCNHRLNPPLVFGNISENSFEEVWNNFSYRFFRRTINTAFRFEKCNWCYENRIY